MWCWSRHVRANRSKMVFHHSALRVLSYLLTEQPAWIRALVTPLWLRIAAMFRAFVPYSLGRSTTCWAPCLRRNSVLSTRPWLAANIRARLNTLDLSILESSSACRTSKADSSSDRHSDLTYCKTDCLKRHKTILQDCLKCHKTRHKGLESLEAFQL